MVFGQGRGVWGPQPIDAGHLFDGDLSSLRKSGEGRAWLFLSLSAKWGEVR